MFGQEVGIVSCKSSEAVHLSTLFFDFNLFNIALDICNSGARWPLARCNNGLRAWREILAQKVRVIAVPRHT